MSRGDRIGILLFEDGDVRKNRYTLTAPNNVLMLSTAQFLMGLEREGVIRNAYDILDRITGARGLEIRNPHLHATPGAEKGVDDWSEDFTP